MANGVYVNASMCEPRHGMWKWEDKMGNSPNFPYLLREAPPYCCLLRRMALTYHCLLNWPVCFGSTNFSSAHLIIRTLRLQMCTATSCFALVPVIKLRFSSLRSVLDSFMLMWHKLEPFGKRRSQLRNAPSRLACGKACGTLFLFCVCWLMCRGTT